MRLRKWYAEPLGIDQGGGERCSTGRPAAFQTPSPDSAAGSPAEAAVFHEVEYLSGSIDLLRSQLRSLLDHHMVDDVDAILARLTAKDARIDPKRQDYDHAALPGSTIRMATRSPGFDAIFDRLSLTVG
jgi:hypothetical protein